MINKKLLDLEKIINVKFNNRDLLRRSLIHKSYNNETNNEKLEFLGDRVLGLVLSKALILIYTNEKEGVIDKKFSNLVNKKICAKIASEINLKKFMIVGESNKKTASFNEKIISDGSEDIIGAIFLDKFIIKFWKKYLEKSDFTLIDSKTRLQEYSLKKFKKLPIYKGVKQTGPIHRPMFKVEVQITGSKIFSGIGSSKKNAQQNAAEKLLKEIKL